MQQFKPRQHKLLASAPVGITTALSFTFPGRSTLVRIRDIRGVYLRKRAPGDAHSAFPHSRRTPPQNPQQYCPKSVGNRAMQISYNKYIRAASTDGASYTDFSTPNPLGPLSHLPSVHGGDLSHGQIGTRIMARQE